MSLKQVFVIALMGFASALAVAETKDEATIRKAMDAKLEGRVKIVSVTKTPYSGLFEVRTDSNDIFYTDKGAKYMFVGSVINATTHEDITKGRVETLTKVKFTDLPFDLAVKIVKGNGKRAIAVFEDPNCGYCKRLRQSLQELDNVTIYTFMYNILAEDSVVKSRNIWCSADRGKAWDDWMLHGKAPANAPATCLTDPNERIFELGQKLKINGTPTIFLADGTRIPGVVDMKTLEAKLGAIKQ